MHWVYVPYNGDVDSTWQFGYVALLRKRDVQALEQQIARLQDLPTESI